MKRMTITEIPRHSIADRQDYDNIVLMDSYTNEYHYTDSTLLYDTLESDFPNIIIKGTKVG